MMFVWIRGHSEILDWTPRPVTVLLYNCVPSLLAPGLHSQWAPGCSLPSSEHGSQAGAVAVASKDVHASWAGLLQQADHSTLFKQTWELSETPHTSKAGVGAGDSRAWR